MIKYIIVLFIGGIIGVFLSNYTFFVFKEEIEIADLVSLAITSLIGIHIAGKLAVSQSNVRYEKDFLIGEIKEFQKGISVIKTHNDIGTVNFELIKRVFRDLNQDLTHIEGLVQISKFPVQFDDVRGKFAHIRRQILNLSPSNGTITIGGRRNTVDKALDELKRELYGVIMKINSSTRKK